MEPIQGARPAQPPKAEVVSLSYESLKQMKTSSDVTHGVLSVFGFKHDWQRRYWNVMIHTGSVEIMHVKRSPSCEHLIPVFTSAKCDKEPLWIGDIRKYLANTKTQVWIVVIQQKGSDPKKAILCGYLPRKVLLSSVIYSKESSAWYTMRTFLWELFDGREPWRDIDVHRALNLPALRGFPDLGSQSTVVSMDAVKVTRDLIDLIERNKERGIWTRLNQIMTAITGASVPAVAAVATHRQFTKEKDLGITDQNITLVNVLLIAYVSHKERATPGFASQFLSTLYYMQHAFFSLLQPSLLKLQPKLVFAITGMFVPKESSDLQDLCFAMTQRAFQSSCDLWWRSEEDHAVPEIIYSRFMATKVANDE